MLHAIRDFNKELAAAGAVGAITCRDCGFEFHRVIGRCPLCRFAPWLKKKRRHV
jgi:predicted Zn-ribbon and HTH transcriptional regulator